MSAQRFGLLAAGVLLVHALLLRGVHDAFTARPGPAPDRLSSTPPAVRTRALDPAVQVEPAAALGAPEGAAGPAPARVASSGPRQPAVRGGGSVRPTAMSASPASRAAEPARPPPPAVTDVSSNGAAEPASSVGGLPVYRTLPPPPFTFSYDLRRGASSGSAELQWRPEGGRYQARLAGTVDGSPLLTLESAGSFDSAGLAPARHTDRRRGSATQAANFQRETGKVTFSGPAVEHALPPGAQDRLSWMVQLAAIAAADPSLVGPGGRVTLPVVSARGDADLWTFAHVGDEAPALAEGRTPTLHLLREPRRPYDTRAEVWLDPARHYLPVRARLSNGPDRDELQLELREVLQPP